MNLISCFARPDLILIHSNLRYHGVPVLSQRHLRVAKLSRIARVDLEPIDAIAIDDAVALKSRLNFFGYCLEDSALIVKKWRKTPIHAALTGLIRLYPSRCVITACFEPGPSA